jgi:hypothetical protein
MATATWRGRPILLDEFLIGGGVLVARCASPNCRTASVLDAAVVRAAGRSSISRLEEAIRCTCGARGGRLKLWRGAAPPPVGRDRCFLFRI